MSTHLNFCNSFLVHNSTRHSTVLLRNSRSNTSRCRLQLQGPSNGSPSLSLQQHLRTSSSSLRQRRPLRQPQVTASAVVCAGTSSEQAPAKTWPGVKPLPLLLSIGLGLALRFLVPIPSGLTTQGWTLLSIFVSTIAGLVLEPLPTGAWAFLAVTVSIFTKTLTFSQAFTAFSNDVIWLIVVSFFFAAGFQKTGLGERVANLFVAACGKSTLGLAYGLSVAEACLAPAMPSTTARAGGIFMPIINSLALASGSEPGKPSAGRLGKFLVQSQFQGSVHSSALFLTAAAQNLLCMKLAAELGVNIPSPWVTWFKGAAVPALLGLLITPLIMYKLVPPEVKDTPEAPKQAKEKLRQMGPMTRDELIMSFTMLGAVILWVLGDQLQIPAVTSAMLGLTALLMTGVLQWKDCLTYSQAWDTLFWFAVLVGMSGQLNGLGVIKYFADVVGGKLIAANLGWPVVFGMLNMAYFGLHYMFASQTAHVGALYAAFLAMMLSAGVPGVLAALSLAYVSNLFGSMTHYGSGQAAVYYGAGYVTLQEVFSVGGIMVVVNTIIWALAGAVWWKLCGFF
ncbi:Sodium/sulfate symporter [Coccomyxa subellipsoidea C-169]|uniref:Sodium/sulfate symporter n=1 Tax=Coccomyxa subellipsoidea (strain C-169) TaxID=574566 RepID=I0ZA59_COCSC|nr:Sodium/sulfate symporter [Coccomyxa subellipsoidea C-169]EIE27528.1 Sodium/sulfate symporter [Coccomyxa subellipsoidea C-169]|eukprot:XP_005652072.1 Sodium/sulfate symporter [Coccomyxa subellipsoidea C-169]